MLLSIICYSTVIVRFCVVLFSSSLFFLFSIFYLLFFFLIMFCFSMLFCVGHVFIVSSKGYGFACRPKVMDTKFSQEPSSLVDPTMATFSPNATWSLSRRCMITLLQCFSLQLTLFSFVLDWRKPSIEIIIPVNNGQKKCRHSAMHKSSRWSLALV